MKLIVISFFLCVSGYSYSQNIKNDSIKEYVDYTDKLGNKKKALVVKVPQILIIDGDSIYSVSDEFQLRFLLEKQEGFNIINNPDSISLFLRTRVSN